MRGVRLLHILIPVSYTHLDVYKRQEQEHRQIRFLIYGSGDEKARLEKRCRDESITNVIFKGWIEKRFVPSVLKKAYVNILHNSSTSLDKYGQSQNKLFEYLAAGRCIAVSYTHLDVYKRQGRGLTKRYLLSISLEL